MMIRNFSSGVHFRTKNTSRCDRSELELSGVIGSLAKITKRPFLLVILQVICTLNPKIPVEARDKKESAEMVAEKIKRSWEIELPQEHV
ncbi:hypothetical protein [Paenibacillus terreus]|uniref:hypothetical protein n=1 Tax=Paenibacillus terreus TaxID=1387834 RepID=UPI0035CD00B1